MNEQKNIGIITRKDQDFLFVWTSQYPLKELQFPRWSNHYERWFEIGDLVRYKITNKLDELQDPTNLKEEKELQERVDIIREPNEQRNFSVKVHLSFPPEEFYQKELSAFKNYECCKAFAYSVQFGKVALFSDMHYVPTKFYTGYVTRIPWEKNWIAEKMGTLFVIVDDKNKPISEITDPKLQEAIYQKLPWKDQYIIPNEQQSHNIKEEREGFVEQQWTPMNTVWKENDDKDGNDFTDASSTRCIGTSGNVEHIGLNADFRARNFSEDGCGQRPVISVVHGIESENHLFGNLVASKLQWVHERDPETAVRLQRQLIEVCAKYKLKMLAREKPELLEQQQQSTSSTNFLF